jgi:hypothetical protein
MSKKKSTPVHNPNSNRELLFSVTKDDLEIQTFAAGGPGGQHQNTSNTGVRIIHKDSGAAGVARDDRSQTVNKKNALKRMTEDVKFQIWLKRQIWFLGKSPEQRVREDMDLKNLRFEVKDEDGNWRVVSGLLIED